MHLKGTLGESASTAIGPAIGAGAFPSVPQVVPGVVENVLTPLTLESLLLGASAAHRASTSDSEASSGIWV